MLVYFNTKAQVLKIKDLVLMLPYNNEKIDTYLSNKGFEFESIKNSDDLDQLTYLYKLSEWRREYFSKYDYFDGKKMISYCIFDQNAYSKIKQDIKVNGFIFIKQYNYQGKLVLEYKKGKTYLSVWSGKADGETFNAYEINVSNREF